MEEELETITEAPDDVKMMRFSSIVRSEMYSADDSAKEENSVMESYVSLSVIIKPSFSFSGASTATPSTYKSIPSLPCSTCTG